MRVLIFEPSLAGHHLEYLHHIYEGASERPDNEFIFAVPCQEWVKMKDKCTWPESKNISFTMLDDSDCQNLGRGSMLAQTWRLSRYVRRIVFQCNADCVFMISLAGAIPFLPLMLPSRIKLSGIIYKIYLRESKGWISQFIDKIRYSIMAHNNSVNNVFILNDPNSTQILNKTYHTNRFVTLPDPIPKVDVARLVDLRSELCIEPESDVFLHFGAMEERKGTLEILRALCIMNKNTLAEKTFIFAGCVGSSIKEVFYCLVEKARRAGANIIVKDEFCSFDYLHSLCKIANCILIPYLFTSLSSGALGYSALHETPVIGPRNGLIGELIENNGLGLTIETIDPEHIAEILTDFVRYEIKSQYVKQNSIENFIRTVFQKNDY